MTDHDAVEVSVHIAAEPETVFPYFTDPIRYTQWMGTDADFEPVPGGRYRVRMRDGVEAAGEFVEVDPPRRVVFTWGWVDDPEVAPGSTRVVVTLERVDGGTQVVLRHYDLPSSSQRDHHREGWSTYLSRLAIRVRGGDPGSDPNAQLHSVE
jgi:uncharacterized protein YndB with AHSA1/START domain